MVRRLKAVTFVPVCLVAMAALMLLAAPSIARAAQYPRGTGSFIQQGGKLIGSGLTGNPKLGMSVALSSDGNTLLLGGNGDNQNIGAVWAFGRTTSGWVQQGVKLTPSSGGGNFGAAVALSADGNTALIGSESDDVGAGSAWIFVRAGGVWSEQKKLTPSAVQNGAAFGASVALSADGNTALVGGPYAQYIGTGAAWVFSRHPGYVWTEDAWITGYTDNFGQSVALSADGNTALIGGPVGSPSTVAGGSVTVEVRSNGVWTQQAWHLTPNNEVGNAYFGSSAALSADGNTALVGGPMDNGSRGAAWLYSRSGDAWTQGAKLTPSNEQGSGMFGSAVALSNDGDTAVIGGDIDNNKVGAAWVFSGLGGIWMLGGAKLTASDEIGQGHFGYSVSLSGDGRTALIGAPYDNGVFPDGIGAGFVFAPDFPTPTPTPTVAPTPTPSPTPAPTPAVTLKLRGLKRGAVKLGKSVTAAGVVTPTSLSGRKVTLTAQRKKGAKWVKAKKFSTLIASTGAYSGRYKPAKKGAYRLRATIAKTATYAAVTSKWLAFKVK